MQRSYYAHTAPQSCAPIAHDPFAGWQTLNKHLEEVAILAAQFTSAFGAEDWGKLAGLWHDLGKYSDAFQNYLLASSEGDDLHRADVSQKVDHSTAGAQHASSLQPTLGRILAYCIAGHHAGLPDAEGGQASLRQRLMKSIETYETNVPSEVLKLPLPERINIKVDKIHPGFSCSFFVRMLFSALVDADFLNTERHMAPEKSAERPDGKDQLPEIRERFNQSLQSIVSSADTTLVNQKRLEVLQACHDRAGESPGYFSLNVPTGGGKTLSSLAFALDHAHNHNLRRIVYAIPFTSIIEQTADVFRDVLGECADSILEHHSNLDQDDPNRQSLRTRLAAENFDSELIVTTNVQLFESLFATRTSRCRKLHRLARSVIILDEAQTLPPNLLAPTLAALNELVRNYGCTVVLCTATQPAVEQRQDFRIGLSGVRPIIENPVQLAHDLRRTNVVYPGKLTNEQIVERLMQDSSGLCIVNTRRHAREIFETLLEYDAQALHLSASQCASHRSDTVEEIRRRLDAEESCRVVSTQVIEAGVDVDFPLVLRAVAGLDSIAQAAGRCNREGAREDSEGHRIFGEVVVFEYDRKAYRTPSFILKGAAHFSEIEPDHSGDLLAPAAIEAYFRLYYWSIGKQDGSGWDCGKDKKSIMGCFDLDKQGLLHAQFREAQDAYRMIEDEQTPLLVPYGERGQALIEELQRMPDDPDPMWLRGFDRRAQRFAVGARDRPLNDMLHRGVITERHGRYYAINSKVYDLRLGLLPDEGFGMKPEDLTGI